MARRLLLLSNSTSFGQGYLDHAMPAVRAFLGPIRRLVFVPFALADRDTYAEKARQRFAKEGIEVEPLPGGEAGAGVLGRAQAVFVGGGNTFRLLKTLQETGLFEPLRDRAQGGMPYLGASAGTNLATPTIGTTNDMPIVQPAGFQALGLVPFQINPHYLDADPGSRHMGETREERIREFLEENDRVVLGLREGGWLRIEGDAGRLEGDRPARVFRRHADPEEIPAGSPIDSLLSE